MKFFESLDGLWKDLAIIQFFLSARIQEAAGLTIDAIDLDERIVEIKKVIVWSRENKKFSELKEMPKNGNARYCHISDEMFEIIVRRIEELPKDCQFIFHIDGEPLSYRTIQYRYNKALKKAGLFPEFSSTHLMRHSMATITRKVTRSLDATQAVTGHRDQRLVEHYSTIPEEAQMNAVKEVEAFLKKAKNKERNKQI